MKITTLAGWAVALATLAALPVSASAACPKDDKAPSLTCPGDDKTPKLLCPGDDKTPKLLCPGDEKKVPTGA